MHVAKTRAVAGTMDGASLRELRKNTYKATWIKYPDREKLIVKGNKDYFDTVKAYLVDWKYMGEPVVNEGTFKYCALYADNEKWQAFIMGLRELYDNVPNEDKNPSNLFAIQKLAEMRQDYQKKVWAAKQKKKQRTKGKPPESSTGAPQKHPFKLGSATVQSPPTAGGGKAAPTMDQSAVPRQNNATAQSGFLPPKPETRKKARYLGDAAPGGGAADVSLQPPPFLVRGAQRIVNQTAKYPAGSSWGSMVSAKAASGGNRGGAKPSVWAKTAVPKAASGTGKSRIAHHPADTKGHGSGPAPRTAESYPSPHNFFSAPPRGLAVEHGGSAGGHGGPAGGATAAPPQLYPRPQVGEPGAGFYPSQGTYDPAEERRRMENSKNPHPLFLSRRDMYPPPPPHTSEYHREQMLQKVAQHESDYRGLSEYYKTQHGLDLAAARRQARDILRPVELTESNSNLALRNWAKDRVDREAAARQGGAAAETEVLEAAAAELAAEAEVEAAMTNLTL